MNNYKFERWKKERDITIEEDFVSALTKYAKEYKKKQLKKYEGYLCPFGS